MAEDQTQPEEMQTPLETPVAETKTPESPAADNVVTVPELTVTVQEISRGAKPEQRPLHPNTVAFKIAYPKDYPKEKQHMKNGEIVYVSKEVAAHFTKNKIGSVVK